MFANQAEQLLQADELLQERVGILGQVAHAHQLDKAQLVTTLQAVFEQRHHLIEVLAAQRHHVDLDLDSCSARLVHAIEHGGQVATTGDAAEGVRVQGIERDVDTPNAGIHQQRQFARQQLAVGGQADIAETHATDCAHEGFQLGADQRLATRDAQSVDARRFDQVSHTTGHGLGREFVLGSHQPLAVGHAVGTRVVAG